MSLKIVFSNGNTCILDCNKVTWENVLASCKICGSNVVDFALIPN